jgi:hypothetical protein
LLFRVDFSRFLFFVLLNWGRSGGSISLGLIFGSFISSRLSSIHFLHSVHLLSGIGLFRGWVCGSRVSWGRRVLGLGVLRFRGLVLGSRFVLGFRVRCRSLGVGGHLGSLVGSILRGRV